jgi:hypothetical protein
MTEDAANNGGGAGTTGPPTKPKKRGRMADEWMTAGQVAEESQKHHESVLAALRKGHLKGSQASAKAPWLIKRRDFNDWMDRGAPCWNKAA